MINRFCVASAGFSASYPLDLLNGFVKNSSDSGFPKIQPRGFRLDGWQAASLSTTRFTGHQLADFVGMAETF
jgi:hypothetical protein